jgi:hypothetical protein
MGEEMGWFSKKKSWEVVYAENLYDGLVATDDLDMTPEKLRAPMAAYAQYREKALVQREAMCFTALMLAAGQDSGLASVLREFGRLLVEKLASRGVNVNVERVVEITTQEVHDMTAQPFSWAKGWLAEFRNDPNADYMVALFADHSLKQYRAFQYAIEAARTKR